MSGDFTPFDKGFGQRQNNRLLKLIRKYRVLPTRPGWQQTEDGIEPPPTPEPGTSTASRFWNLTLSADTSGNFTVGNPGTILQDVSDITSGVTISNIATEITAADGMVVCLKITDQEPTTCTVQGLTTWNDYPAKYEITGTGGSATFTALYEPLYHISATQSTGYASVGNGFYALRLVQDTCFRVVNTVYRQSSSEPALAVPALEPCHRVVPS